MTQERPRQGERGPCKSERFLLDVVEQSITEDCPWWCFPILLGALVRETYHAFPRLFRRSKQRSHLSERVDPPGR